jgi:hypothetical protein
MDFGITQMRESSPICKILKSMIKSAISVIKNGGKVKYLYHVSLMKRLLICCLLLLYLSSQKVLADVFIVTSTLPSGPGSLRDALEKAAANRDLVTDTIKFDISRARELIIRIPVNDLLPALSNKLVTAGA